MNSYFGYVLTTFILSILFIPSSPCFIQTRLGITYECTYNEYMQASYQACVRFIKLLIQHKLRPTTLYPVVLGLPQSMPDLFMSLHLYFQPAFRKTHPLVYKGACIQSLALLADNLGQTTEVLNLFKEAKEIFILARDYDAVAGCMQDVGI
jgi:hypothetical protein